jgi:hypothetical protein
LFDDGGLGVDQPKMSLALAFETAMVDAINVFVRDVLRPRGLLAPGASDEIGSEAVLQAKYRVAREWAASWAAFDGYVRQLVPEQRHAGQGAIPGRQET